MMHPRAEAAPVHGHREDRASLRTRGVPGAGPLLARARLLRARTSIFSMLQAVEVSCEPGAASEKVGALRGGHAAG